MKNKTKMKSKKPRVSLLVTTYNSPRYLELSIRSIFNQRRLPDEILVADDGSGEETRLLVEELAAESFVPLRHIWHPDKGFRLSAIRNKAIEAANGDYIIQIDGDIILHPAFVLDHMRIARKGSFITGSRVLLTKETTDEIISSDNVDLAAIKTIKKGLNGRRMPLLTPFMTGYKSRQGEYVRGCNMAFWREDLLRVNGYNEDITGWGREDSELSWRLINAGVKKRFLKFGGIEYHLHHNENAKDRDPRNIELMEHTRTARLTWAKNGIFKERN